MAEASSGTINPPTQNAIAAPGLLKLSASDHCGGGAAEYVVSEVGINKSKLTQETCCDEGDDAVAGLRVEQARLERLIAEQERALGGTRRTAEQLAPGHSASWWLRCSVVAAVLSILMAIAFKAV